MGESGISNAATSTGIRKRDATSMKKEKKEIKRKRSKKKRKKKKEKKFNILLPIKEITTTEPSLTGVLAGTNRKET